MATDTETADAPSLHDLVDGARFAMLTTPSPEGELHGRPLTVQRVDEDGTIWFLVGAEAEWATPEALRNVNVGVAKGDTWVSAAGRATLVRDQATLEDLGDPVSSAWFDDEHPPVALRVDVSRADYWAGPGKVAQVLKMAKAAITQDPPDEGDRGVIRP